MTKNLDLTLNDLAALQKFRREYPTWWYMIIVSDACWGFICRPQDHSPEIEYIKSSLWRDIRFRRDCTVSLESAIQKMHSEINNKCDEAERNWK